jgi:hypothetical protein
MPLLLVDDRDGRIVAEVETMDEVSQVLDAWLREDRRIPEYLCLVRIDGRHGPLVGTETTVRVRPLLW